MIKVVENNESLVDILDYCPSALNGFNDLRKKFGSKMLVRLSLAKMLQTAEKELPKDVTFLILDAWRPKVAQEAYFNAYVRKFSKKHPEWSMNRVKKQASVYAINPFTELNRAGHLTGGAIDVVLAKEGIRIPMKAQGVPYEEGLKLDAKGLTKDVSDSRMILKECMMKAGFTNYPPEYWHWCYGDYIWAELNKKGTTLYGPID